MSLEQCTFLPATEADCLPTSFSDTDQLPLLNGTPTPARSSENEPQTDGFPACECMRETSACSIHPNTPESWTAFMRASLAKTLALLESRQAYLREPDQVFTAKSCASLAWYDQGSSTWRTYQQSFLTGSEPYSETWPRWGMTVGGSAYAHPMSEQTITETDGSFWPTPNTAGYRSDGELQMLSKKTATYREYRLMSDRAASSKRNRYWPTPTAHNAKETGAASQMNRNTVQLGDLVGGSLNPQFVEWLMGFPIGFTVSKDWVTPKYHSKRPLLTDCLEACK